MSNLWAQHCDDCSGSGSTCEEFDPATCNSCVNYDWDTSGVHECPGAIRHDRQQLQPGTVAAWLSDADGRRGDVRLCVGYDQDTRLVTDDGVVL